MADATYNEVIASVPDRFDNLEKEGRIGFFPGTGLFNSGILENPNSKGGGANVRLRITVASPTPTLEADDYVSRTNLHGDTHSYLSFEYQRVAMEFTISKLEIAAIDAEAESQLAYVDGKLYNATEASQQYLEEQFWSVTTMTDKVGGPKAWLSGSAFGGLTRADTVVWEAGGTTAALSTVLGTGSAYDYSTYDATKPTRTQTYWDCSVDYAAATDPGEMLAKAIFQMFWLIKRQGSKGKPTHLCMGKAPASILAYFVSNKPNSALQYGLQKSMTAMGTSEGLTFLGMEFYDSELVGDTDVFLINKNYTYVPALRGYDPKKWAKEQGPSPSFVHATAFSFLSAFKFVTDSPIMHGWISL